MYQEQINTSQFQILSLLSLNQAITITPISNLFTNEGGGTATFTIALKEQPSANVTFDLASSDPSEGIVSPTTLVFTRENYNFPQTITITGQNDLVADGDIKYTIVTSPASSKDSAYQGMDPLDISVTNIDDDATGATLSKTSASVTEGGVTDSYSIVLNTQPTNDVTISVSSSSSQTVNPTSITFNSTNWNIPQFITVTAVDDWSAQGTHTGLITHSISSLDSYNGLFIPDVSVTIVDNDTIGVTLSKTTASIVEGGATDSYSISLNTQPLTDVTVSVSSDSSQTVNPTSITFNSTNWNIPQFITVTAVDDWSAQGTHTGSITHSVTSSDSYNGFIVSGVGVTIADNDTIGVTLSKKTASIAEGGATDSYTIVLNTKPNANVTVSLSPDSQETVSPSSLTFTPVNWQSPQTITITAVNDLVAEGSHNGTIIHSVTASDGYNGLIVPNLSISISDNDTAGYTISSISRYTSESGISATFTIRLNTQPTDTINIPLSSSAPSEGTVSPLSLNFTVSNWDTDQIVTVTGVDDAAIDGNITYSIITGTPSGSDSSGYLSLNPPDVTVINWDNDSHHIFRTQGHFNGNFGGPSGADTVCNSQAAANGYPGSFKALLVDGFNNTRIACTNANCSPSSGSDYVDWVLLPNTNYYRAEDNAFIGTTNALRIFPFPLNAAFTSDPGQVWSSNFHWSGIGNNWRPASVIYVGNLDCDGWTATTGSGLFGRDWELTTLAIDTGQLTGCSAALRLICVEQ